MGVWWCDVMCVWARARVRMMRHPMTWNGIDGITTKWKWHIRQRRRQQHHGQKKRARERNWKLKTDIKYNHRGLIPLQRHCYWHVQCFFYHSFSFCILGCLNWTFLPHWIHTHTHVHGDMHTQSRLPSSAVEMYDILFNWFIVLIYWYLLCWWNNASVRPPKKIEPLYSRIKTHSIL